MPAETSSPQAQTWIAALTAIAGALAVVAKKRFTPKPRLALPSHTLEILQTKLDSNHKELLAAVSTQGSAIEKRLDALESAVARLDERTKNLSTL